MNKGDDFFSEWASQLENLHIPRWSAFPDIELYVEQVVSLVEKYTGIFFDDGETAITRAMINNYVKLKLIPPAAKKKYNRIHLAYLITITILKQVITIPEIRDGIQYQAKISGAKEAYDLFCSEQEYAFKAVLGKVSKSPFTSTEQEDCFTAVRMVTLAFASKSVARKIIHMQEQENKQ